MTVLLGALLATSAVGCGGSAVDSDESLAEFETSTIAVAYSWIGLGSSQGYEFSGTCTSDLCDLTVVCRDSTDGSPGGATTPLDLPPASIDARLIAAFVATFDDLDPIAEPTEVIEHTDDYPDLEIGLTDSAGGTLTFTTSSNTADRTPWNVEFAGKLYASDESASAHAYSALVKATGAAACWG